MKSLPSILLSSLLLAVGVAGVSLTAKTIPTPTSPPLNLTEAEVQTRLETILVEDFKITKVRLSQAVEYLDGITEPHGVQILFREADEKDPVVSLKTRDLSLARNLTFLCRQAGYSWSVQAGIVVVAEPGILDGEGEPLITEIISVKSPTVRRLATAGAEAP